MDTKEISAELKNELNRNLDRLAALRDEAKLHLHLATLDAKQEWNDNLEPKIGELQSNALQLGSTSKEMVQEVLKSAEEFVAKLRSRASSS
jgi:hypothetical protein